MRRVPESVKTVKDPSLPTGGDDDFADRTPEQFNAWLREQAARVRLQASPDAAWLADRIERMAQLARFLAAPDGLTYDEREQISERARDRELLEARYGFGLRRN